ncbi:hypothetical protein NNC19_03385 [Clostridium sp. SHJSY1]|uniref:hypothetical protein n=1 Tax=Clostridium sp. SHJSY1 TaxID=2942483 RepID=UPI002876D571|nr:hypothetical protein [Clostridium sp. SHJSY1]MDS0524708.1 hypothetical protein [Clostridium sp. SHJSY1]
MNKKILLTTLAIMSSFIVGCSNKENKQPLSNDTTSQESDEQLSSNIDNTSENNNAVIKSNESSRTQNATSTLKNEESFYGNWVIEKAIGYSKGGTYSQKDIKKLVGKKLSFSKEKSSSFGDDVSYLNNIVKNPNYKKSNVTPNEFETNFRASVRALAINSKNITEIEVVDDKGSSSCTFFIKDNNTLILYGGGTFFQLNRAK